MRAQDRRLSVGVMGHDAGDMKPRSPRRFLHVFSICCAVAVQAFCIVQLNYIAVCLVAIATSIAATLVCRGGRVLIGLLLIPGTLYALGPYFAAGSGDRLWPYPAFDTYVQSMTFMLWTLYLAAAILAALGLHLRVGRSLPKSVDAVLLLSRYSTVAVLAGSVCMVLAAQAWYVYFTGPAGGAGRRETEHLFWAAGSLTGQVWAIVCSVLILAPLMSGQSRKWTLRVGLFLGLWTPFLLGGGRRLLVYVGVPIFIAGFSVGSARLRQILSLTGTVGLTWFVMVPVIFPNGGSFAAHGEWSISGAPFVALFEGSLSAQSVGATTWPANIVRALPDFLGGGSAVPLADALAKTDLYPAGTSGSPWSDAWDGGVFTSALWFFTIVLAITMVLLVSEKMSPGALIFGMASLSIFGRSHAPYAIMTIFFPVLVILLFKVAEAIFDRGSSSEIRCDPELRPVERQPRSDIRKYPPQTVIETKKKSKIYNGVPTFWKAPE